MINKQKISQDAFSLIAERARNNLVDFEIATDPKYEPNWHHELIAKELEHIEFFGDRDYKILLVFVPPRHGKSQQCTIDFPSWALGKVAEREVITISYSADLAEDFGSKTRTKMEGEAFAAIFPDVIINPDERAKGRWKTNKGGGYTSVGVGGPITGRGANILICDDLIKNREEANSEVYRNKTWEWLTSTAFTRLEPNGVMIVVVTRWHDDDIGGRILNHPDFSNRIKIIKLPAIAESDEAQLYDHRAAGFPLWPARWPKEALEERKNFLGPYDWASLYQQAPILTEHQEFKPAWKKTISERELELRNTRNTLTVDTAMSKRTQADSTGFCDNSVDKENFWHLKAWRAKLGAEELVDTLFTLHAKRRYEKIGIEKTAYTDGLKPFIDSEQRKRGVFLPIVELKHNQTSKEIRIRGLIPRYAAGSIFHVDGWCKDLESEQASFPLGAHDDVLDAVAYQLQLVDDKPGGEKIEQYRPKAPR